MGKEEYNKLLIETFPKGHEFEEITVQCDFRYGDIVKFKPEYETFESPDCYVSRDYFSKRKCDHTIEWEVSEIYIKYDDNGISEPYFGFLTAQTIMEGRYLPWWIKNISSKYFVLVRHADGSTDEKTLRETFKLPYRKNTICWHFSNYMFDCFTPERGIVDSYTIRVHKDASMNAYANYVVWYNEEKHPIYSSCSFIKAIPNKDYSDAVGYEIGLMSIDIARVFFSDKSVFNCFAKYTWKRDSFRNARFGQPIYEQFLKDIGRTWEELEDGAKSTITKGRIYAKLYKFTDANILEKPKKRKKKDKEMSSKTKLKNILAGLTEEDKKEMLKLLSKK